MKFTITAAVSLALMLSSLCLYSQEEHDHQHENHDHLHELKNEIGGAIGIFFDLDEQQTGSGFHLHYTRILPGKMERFGISPGLEFVFGEHKHYTMHLMFMYRPLYGWWLAVGPGITYFDHHEEWGLSGHVETGYEFDAGKVHFGPVVEYSWARDDQHIMIGLHLGVPF